MNNSANYFRRRENCTKSIPHAFDQIARTDDLDKHDEKVSKRVRCLSPQTPSCAERNDLLNDYFWVDLIQEQENI